jgi:hypothetical protein
MPIERGHVFFQEMFLQTVCIIIPLLVLFIIPQTAPFSMDSSHFNPSESPKRCSYLRDHGMMAVDCYGLDLTAVPQNLRTDIEVCFSSWAELRLSVVGTVSHIEF